MPRAQNTKIDTISPYPPVVYSLGEEMAGLSRLQPLWQGQSRGVYQIRVMGQELREVIRREILNEMAFKEKKGGKEEQTNMQQAARFTV